MHLGDLLFETGRAKSGEKVFLRILETETS